MPKVSRDYWEERRRHIINAAFSYFSRKGFHKTTMRDIYQEAGLSSGAVYHYFRSKEEIIEAVYSANTEQNIEMISERMHRGDIVEALASVFRQALAKFESPSWRQESRVNVQIWGEALINPKLGDLFLPSFKQYYDIIAQGVAQGQTSGRINPRLSPEMVARVIFSLFLGLELQLALESDIDIAMYRNAAVALIEGTLVVKGEDNDPGQEV